MITLTDKLAFILLIVSLLAGSCGPKTRTITPLSKADRASIKNVAIHVQVDDELDAIISKMKGRFVDPNSCTGGIECLLMIPIIIVAIIVEESIRSNIDNKKAEEFREDISDIKMDRLISERIDEYFETTDAPFEAEISEILNPSILVQQGFDSLLDITIEKLDVKLCPSQVVYGYISNEEAKEGSGPLSSDDVEYRHTISRWNAIYRDYFWKTNNPTKQFLYSADATRVSKEEADEIDSLVEEIEMLRPVVEEYTRDSVRTWITFKGKMISTRDGRVIWDREELYYDPKCENVEDMQSNPEVIVDMLTRAIHDIAVNTVNEIQ